MQPIRFWGTGLEDGRVYDPNRFYYWVSNETTANIQSSVYSSGDALIAALTSFNPATGSLLTPLYFSSISFNQTVVKNIYEWYDRWSSPVHVDFTVIYNDWVLMGGAGISYDEIQLSGLTAQDRIYVRKVTTPQPTGSNNIVYRNDSHRTVYLEFWNPANTSRLYQLEVPSGSTVQDNCAVNLTTVGIIKVGYNTDSIGGMSYGVSNGPSILGGNAVIFSQLGMVTGGGSYASSGANFTGDNSYYPLFFYSVGNYL